MSFLIKMKAEVHSVVENQSSVECDLTLSRVYSGDNDYIVISCQQFSENPILTPLVLVGSRIKSNVWDSTESYRLCQERPETAIFDGDFLSGEGELTLSRNYGNVIMEGTINGLRKVIKGELSGCQFDARDLVPILFKAEKVPWDFEIYNTG